VVAVRGVSVSSSCPSCRSRFRFVGVVRHVLQRLASRSYIHLPISLPFLSRACCGADGRFFDPPSFLLYRCASCNSIYCFNVCRHSVFAVTFLDHSQHISRPSSSKLPKSRHAYVVKIHFPLVYVFNSVFCTQTFPRSTTATTVSYSLVFSASPYAHGPKSRRS
jgi:hypothetical protein